MSYLYDEARKRYQAAMIAALERAESETEPVAKDRIYLLELRGENGEHLGVYDMKDREITTGKKTYRMDWPVDWLNTSKNFADTYEGRVIQLVAHRYCRIHPQAKYEQIRSLKCGELCEYWTEMDWNEAEDEALKAYYV